MQTTFKTDSGKAITPDFFAVYYRKDGSTFRKIQKGISEYDLFKYDNITKVELYENGTENEAAKMIDRIAANL